MRGDNRQSQAHFTPAAGGLKEPGARTRGQDIVRIDPPNLDAWRRAEARFQFEVSATDGL